LRQFPFFASRLSKLKTNPSAILSIRLPAPSQAVGITNNLPAPDFDETGYMGRQQVVDQLIQMLKGPYPVITIVGEGGMGKTALALKVSYEVVDLATPLFDAVIWTSAKTTQLTTSQIVEIDGAIQNSLGLFKSVSDQLAPQTQKDYIEEILEYLGAFKILLVLDNLETVIDERIRRFMEMLPNGSKILITSRIGLGAFERPLKLEQLDTRDAVQLMRVVARSRGVERLVKVSNEQLAIYCNRMSNNPLYIKWFISAVQSGRRAEEILAKPDIFLDFCMSNVYQYLTNSSRTVLKSMQAVPGEHTVAELAFLNDSLVLSELETSIYQLLSTNMVRDSSVGVGGSFQTSYDLTELARAYLTRHHPLTHGESKILTQRRRELTRERERFVDNSVINPYAFLMICTRLRSDVIVASMLRNAINDIKYGDHASAERQISEARQLAPDYYEVRRIEAYLRREQGYFTEAQQAYEAALELEPNYAPLHFWYAGFLMVSLEEYETALSELEKAMKLDAQAYQVRISLTRVHLHLGDFSSARKQLDWLGLYELIPDHDRRRIVELNIDYHCKLSEYYKTQYRLDLAVDQLEKLWIFWRNLPQEFKDPETRFKLRSADRVAHSCKLSISLNVNSATQDLMARVDKIRKFLDETA